MKFLDFGKLLLVTAIACCVSLLISKKADAGQFSKIVAIVVATDDGQVTTIPVKPVDVGPTELMAVKPQIASNPFRQVATTRTTRTVCGPDGCKEVEVANSADCPCDCADCTCNTAAAPTQTYTTTTVTSHASSGNCSAGPARRLLGKVGSFVVKGGPIRQALRANRQARRGG